MSAPGNLRSVSKRKETWETPDDLFSLLNDEFRFTLDGAADENNYKIDNYYSPKDNAFEQNPKGEVIWVNPPYGRQLSKWVRLFHRWAEDNVVVVLVPNSTETKWFNLLVSSNNITEVRFLQKRVQFIVPEDSEFIGNRNPSGSVIVVFDKENAKHSQHWYIWRWRK